MRMLSLHTFAPRLAKELKWKNHCKRKKKKRTKYERFQVNAHVHSVHIQIPCD